MSMTSDEAVGGAMAPVPAQLDVGLSETTVSRLAQRVRNDILSGRLPFGARLKLRELSERYGISHMPVRDTLVKLAAEGLIDLQPNRGASVRRIDRQFIENMFDIRMVLEELLIRRAIERSSDAELKVLRPLAASHAHAVADGDRVEVLASNSRFHQYINALARNADAARTLEQGWELIHALRGQAGYADGRLEQIVEEHAALVDAAERRDIERAGRLARQHVEQSRDDVLARLPNLPCESPSQSD